MRVIIFILSLISFLNAQNVSKTEQAYQSELKFLFSTETRLDSLTTVLQYESNKLDSVKINFPDEIDLIKNKMADLMVLTNEVRILSEKTENIQARIDSLRTVLDLKYDTLLDSLDNAGYGNTDNDLYNRIRLKKMLISPTLTRLYFDPQRLLSFLDKKDTSPEEKKLFVEYITIALDDVNEQIKRIRLKKEEINEILNLRKKAYDFLDDISFDDNFGRLSLAPAHEKSLTTDENAFLGGYDHTFLENNNTESFTVLLRQLQIHDGYRSVRFKNLNEYADTLDEVEGKLMEYKSLLNDRIDNTQ